MKAVTFGFGGKLHLMEGARCRTANYKLMGYSTTTVAVGDYYGNCSPNAFGQYYMWEQAYWGGLASPIPFSYLNHKPGAFYYGQLYSTFYNLQGDVNRMFMGRWDGSGIFVNAGNQVFTDRKCMNGRGFQFITPSSDYSFCCNDMGWIEHNGILFACGQYTTAGLNSEMHKMGWAYKDTDVPGATGVLYEAKRRRWYFCMAINKQDRTSKERRMVNKVMKFKGTDAATRALNRHDTICNDLISWRNDILMATSCDIVRFPGGSGQAVWVAEKRNHPTSHCFELYPSGGFDFEGEPVYAPGTSHPDIYLMTGSGVLYRIPLASGAGYAPSGVEKVIDLAEEFYYDPTMALSDRRTTDIMARVRTSSTDFQPTRTCWMKLYNKQLHVFFPTATSGYHYLRCNGDPRDVVNWDDYTSAMPAPFATNDGCVYGYHDNKRNSLFVMHVCYGDIGIIGINTAALKPAGSTVIAELNTDFRWNEIFRGTCGDNPRGLIPYNNVAAYAQAPSGGNTLEVVTSSDYALLRYKLYSAYPVNVNVQIEYSVDERVTWHTARRFISYTTGVPLGEGLENLSASFFGNLHTFYWDYVSDVGMNSGKSAVLRITPTVIR